MQFEFATATRIVFGSGQAAELPAIAAGLGRRVMLATGSRPERHAGLAAALVAQGLAVTPFAVSGEPTTDVAEHGVRLARDARCDMVIGIGGGSVLDVGKVIAAMLSNGGALFDYLEVIGRAQPLACPAVPYIAVPTTAGTGAEVTRNAVLGSPAHGVKVSMRSPHMLPRLALIDPELMRSMPPALTASSGLDALTHVIEPFLCKQPNPLTDALCRDAIVRAARALPAAYRDGDDLAAREDMAVVGLFGGLALANAKLGAVHGFAGPLGGMIDAPHGLLCARLLPVVLDTNLAALRARAPDSPVLARFGELARLVSGDATAEADACVAWAHALCRELQVPALSSFGLAPARIPEAVAKARQASSMKGNPIVLDDDELTRLLERAC
ncbi:iron-containing alcohol dehydrogenase [Chitinivorax sp. PXF-14]|uniref:iron-containing alcohol dehydrogenase n=1 Tax=Chitinivorax sp. PXF-14 TaxID=3230488 RepID=UPI0034677ADC